ncbi:hypothetical protein BDF20DRAFT_860948 [Mycotypha africana]|uniref:uncharacterized protein n=1 Tax=Mycotypha africana TaxID=64632 RepID=UPI002301CA34|nr:uncharacterized protein BDF20DRAFT_860948 [Mycotypha africana]KAI8984628.1 hypothetical protein BDF20DRAFT_860948 [Mycotypha africana]
MSLTVLSQKNIDDILSKDNVEVANAIVDLMGETFAKFTAGHSDDTKALQAQSPQRIGIDTDSRKVLFMPSRLGETTSIKIVSVPTKDGLSGLPATVMVMDEDTGRVQAVMNADSLTAIRTAAGSGLATRYYADENAKNLLVFGAGAQGEAHVKIMLAVRPNLEKIYIWNRSEARKQGLIKELQKAHPTREFIAVKADNSNLEEIVRNADIICTCTNSTEPVLFGKWLKPGVHLNCIGSYRMDMHEIDSETVKKAELIIVDSIDACKHEAGELVKSSKPEQWIEMGSRVLDGLKKTEAERNKRTLFKSVGISVQDSAIAGWILDRAKRSNIGSKVPF